MDLFGLIPLIFAQFCYIDENLICSGNVINEDKTWIITVCQFKPKYDNLNKKWTEGERSIIMVDSGICIEA